MALIKTADEIEKMRRGGTILSQALRKAVEAVAVGVTLRELDRIAEEYIRAHGGTPSFLGYCGSKHDTPFPSTVCISVNEEVVHGLGNRDVVLKEGDVVGLDIGCWYEGLCTDMAVTVPVGRISKEAEELLRVTKESCLSAAGKMKPGSTIADVGREVERIVKPHGYGIVRSLVGHGVGHEVHEEPHIPNYYDVRNEKIVVKEQMCLAVEPMLTLGDYQVETGEDGWSIVTVDGSTGAHFEVTLAVGEDGPEILTPLPV